MVQIIAICASKYDYITEGKKKPNTLKIILKPSKHYFSAHLNRQRFYSIRVHMTGILKSINFTKLLQNNQDVLPAFYI